MDNTFHILNGDALSEFFPNNIKGQKLIVRECLVDGPVTTDNLEAFFKIRSEYLESNYNSEIDSKGKYFNEVVPQFQAMLNIPEASNVFLWFEDDLFCQVNLWFVIYLLSKSKVNLFLVRPAKHSPYGFGGLSESELESCFQNKTYLNDHTIFTQIWQNYQDHDLDKMKEIGLKYQDEFTFLPPAIQAHADRAPKDGELSRPHQAIKEIIEELGSIDFGKVFKEFSSREAIYGFGDFQVKKLFDEVHKLGKEKN